MSAIKTHCILSLLILACAFACSDDAQDPQADAAVTPADAAAMADAAPTPDAQDTSPGNIDATFSIAVPGAPIHMVVGQQGIVVSADTIQRFGYDGVLDANFMVENSQYDEMEPYGGERVMSTRNEALSVRLEDWTPDPSFGTSGVVSLQVPHPLITDGSTYYSENFTGNDDIFAVGNARYTTLQNGQFWIAKFDATGTRVPSFGTDGVLVLGVPEGLPTGWVGASDIAMAPDGTLLLSVVIEDFSVFVRMQPDGTLMSNFGVGGILERNIGDFETGMRIDDAGRILVARVRGGPPAVQRLLADGMLDNSFGNASFAETGAGSRVQHVFLVDGRIIAVGTSAGGYTYVTEIDDNGAINPSFGDGGTVSLTDYILGDAAIDRDGHLLLFGCTDIGTFFCNTSEVWRIFL